jgi:hypothetical protein
VRCRVGKFPSVSSQTKGLKVNDDGSVDVYFAPEAPGWRRDKLGANGSRQELEHLAAPLRAGESFFDKTWRKPGEIELQP